LEAIMKYLPFLALLCCTAGCGLFGGSSEPEQKAEDPAAAKRAETKARLNARQQDLNQVETDLSNVASEREKLGKEEASEKKTNRLIEIARLESDLKQRKASLGDEISQLQSELSGAPAPAAKKPEKAGDALDDLLASNDKKESEEAARLKKKAEDDAAADKARIGEAEAARKAELDERAKQKIEGGRAQAGADGPGYEERWADVIQKVREEIQKYKRF